MALDRLDLTVVIVLAVAVAAYFIKSQYFSKPESSGFLNTDTAGGNLGLKQVLLKIIVIRCLVN